MSIEESRLLGQHLIANSLIYTIIPSDESCRVRENQTPEQSIFGLALAIATEPSKLAQLREMLARLQAASAISEGFSTWATGQIDDRLVSMALEYAHDTEVLLQILSFKCNTLNMLMRDIEDLYRQEKISQRVYVGAKLLLMGFE